MSGSQNESERRRWWRIVWKGSLLLVLGIVLAVGVFLFFAAEPWRSCPIESLDAEEVQSVCVCSMGQSQPIEDQETIRQILDAMKPIRRDWLPAKWCKYAYLVFTLKNGEEIEVDLYSTALEESAFSIDRIYYRGGPEEKLQNLLESKWPELKEATSGADLRRMEEESAEKEDKEKSDSAS